MRRSSASRRPSRRRAAALALACALLAGCAASVPVPRESTVLTTPRMLHVVQERPGEPAADTMLVVQPEGRGTRWLLFDPLGAPRARQILENGQWRNDGFLPPNDSARALFAALIFAWTPQAELASRYGEANLKLRDRSRVLTADGRPILTVNTLPNGDLQLLLDDGTRYVVAPLKEKP